MVFKRKGQMFVVTVVFLIAMVFAVQSLLFTYSEIDISQPPRARDAYVTQNIESIFRSALDSSDSCQEVRKHIIDLNNFVSSSVMGGQEVKVTGNVNCTSGDGWPPPPELTISVFVKKEDGETWATFELSRS
jgi:hypothetical protein